VYRLEVALATGAGPLTIQTEQTWADKALAEEAVDVMKNGLMSQITFWDNKGAYVAVNGRFVIAIQAKEVS
jgi:hypothetical protein